MAFNKITEQDSHYNHLEKMSPRELLRSINEQDQTVATAVEKVIPHIESLVKEIVSKMKAGGRL
ncbi:MAG: N-acetylmuramic acid 6-phosphate etherase, partial [Nonlabens sp.]